MQYSNFHPMEPNEHVMVEFVLEMSDVCLPLLPSSPVEATGTEVPANKPHPTKVKKSRKNPNLSWLYRKQELQALRDESKGLRSRLAELQKNPHHPAKFRACLERRLLKKSQDERTDLRRQLQEHKKAVAALSKVLRSLQDFYHDRGRSEAMAFRPQIAESKPSPKSRPGNAKVFDMLNERIASQCNNLDAIIEEQRRREPVLDSEEVKTISPAGSELELEFSKIRTMPFDADAVWKALWEVFQFGMKSGSRAGVEVTRLSNETMALDALYPVAQASGEVVNVHALAVIKGCVVSNGYVALMEATVEYSAPSSSLRFVTQDSGVFAIKRHRLQPSAGDSQACRLYSTTKIHSSQRYKPEASRRTVEADLAISSMRKFVNTRLQFLDNMVLLSGP